MKLLELYSLATGLEIGDQFLVESFYPLPFEKYITIHPSSGMAGKNYSYYADVLLLLSPFLKANNIEVVQIGGKDDTPLKDCYHLQGLTTIHQSAYLLKNSLLHISNDTWTAHRAGAIGTPLVALYGSTSVANHAPFQFDPSRTIFLESHRGGKRPTFAVQETPKTVDFIPPEEVANSVLKLLGLADKIERKTLYVGNVYLQPLLELVPNIVMDPKIQITGALVLRMDLHHDESIMASNIQFKKCALCLNREINLTLLAQLKQNIVSVRVEVDQISPEWIKGLKKLGIPTSFVAREQDPEKLAALRLKLYDACLFDTYAPNTKEDFFKEAKIFLNKDLDPNLNFGTLKFRTNRMLLSDNKVFLSNAHRLAEQRVPDTLHNEGSVIDVPEFWEDLGHYMIFQ